MFAVLCQTNGAASSILFLSAGGRALGYPVFDYDFPHITKHLFPDWPTKPSWLIHDLSDESLWQIVPQKYMIVAYTFGLNLFLVGVNQVTGGNYGLLKSPPFILTAPYG